MSPQRDPWTGKDTAQCVFMLGGSAFGLAAFTGHLTIDQIHAYAQTAGDLAVPVLTVLAGLLVTLGVLVVAVRLAVRSRREDKQTVSQWHYRRRWNAVVTRHGLAETVNGVQCVP